MPRQMAPGLANGHGLQQNGGFHGQNPGGGSESEENGHINQNVRGSSRLHVDPSLNNDGMQGLSPEDQAIHHQQQATALLMQHMGLGLAPHTEKQWACCLQ